MREVSDPIPGNHRAVGTDGHDPSMIRQQILTRDQPLELAVVLDESVLRRQRGDHALMYVQPHRLVEVSEWPNVTLQIRPLAGPIRLAVDSFTLFQFGSTRETSLYDMVSTENLSNHLYIEGEIDTHEFRTAFKNLVQESLDPEESQEFILRIAARSEIRTGIPSQDAVRSARKDTDERQQPRGK